MAQLTKETTGIQTGTHLEVKHLSVGYLAGSGAVHAVNDVSFTLERGQILGLAGESGCGKSTLAYAIARLLRAPAYITGGEIFYHPRYREDEKGRQLSSTRALAKGKNRPSAEEEMEAVDILKLSDSGVLKAHRPQMSGEARKARAIELLRLVGIAPERLRSYPHELSGGMRQRAMIAIALALTPELIIMDEPTTALDVVMQREILTEIIRLREQFGFSVIFITHDLSLLLELTDPVAIMYAGRMVELASRRDLYLHPRHPYSYGLLNSFPSVRGPATEAGGIPASLVRAGSLGLPLALAIIGGEPARFAPFLKLYREAARCSGHDAATLPVGINSHGYIADTSQEARDEHAPFYISMMNRLGPERGWPKIGRRDYHASSSPRGALVVGSPEEVIEKILLQYEIFGHQRFLMQSSIGAMPHRQILHAIELFGTRVAPIVRRETAPAPAQTE
jgi:peptide/nickel transport system ATP-binding protein